MKEFDRVERKQLVNDLSDLINKHSIENMSNTPDFIIAEYLVQCLENWNKSVTSRNDWFYSPDGTHIIDPMKPNSIE